MGCVTSSAAGWTTVNSRWTVNSTVSSIADSTLSRIEGSRAIQTATLDLSGSTDSKLDLIVDTIVDSSLRANVTLTVVPIVSVGWTANSSRRVRSDAILTVSLSAGSSVGPSVSLSIQQCLAVYLTVDPFVNPRIGWSWSPNTSLNVGLTVKANCDMSLIAGSTLCSLESLRTSQRADLNGNVNLYFRPKSLLTFCCHCWLAS